MKPTKREYRYALENFGGVMHTTLNPEGPGVVRIHMIPPKFDENDIESSVVIINGQDIIPVNVSWSILLAEFIKCVNEYEGREITDEDTEKIINKTAKNIRSVYPFLSKNKVREDIYVIMNTFKQIAYGEVPDQEIEYISMGEYAPFMKAPHRMDLMISAMAKEGKWNYNQQCVHCYAAGEPSAEENELSGDEWKMIIDKCRAAGIPQVTFTGGEPTLRDDLIALIDYSKWFVTRLNTNGVRLTKEYCADLHKASLDSLQITFYSADEEIHNTLVGASRYKDTVAGIENAIEAGISLSINTPLCTLNSDYVKTLEFLHEKGVIYVTCSGLITTGNALRDASGSLQLSEEEISAILKEATEYCFGHGMEISFTSPGWVSDELCASLGINTPCCGAALSNMAVTPSGNAVPCQSWLSGELLGNMLTDEWEKIWNSEKCAERRNYSALMLGECPLRRRVVEKQD